MTEWVTLLTITFVLICVNGVFVAAEFALISASRPRLEQHASEGSRAARFLLRTLSEAALGDRYIATSQLGLSLASLGLGMYAERELVGLLTPWFSSLVEAHAVATVVVLGGLTFADIALGEMVPKSIGLVYAERTALLLAWPMRLFERILAPLVWGLSWIGHVVLRLLGLPISADVSFVYSADELRLIVQESHQKGMLEGAEHDLMQNVIDFSKRVVRQVMVGRMKVVGLPQESTVDEALRCVATDGYTRIPVYERDMDHIVGMLHVKDLVRSRRKFPGTRPVRELVRALPFIPETMPTDALFDRMRADRVQMAVVLDEHGGTAGIVTMEDLIEEVFGEVRDEFDVEEVEPIAALADGTLRVRGDVLLVEVVEHLARGDAHWTDVETLNGLVMDRLGRPPQVGDAVEDQQLRIVVESVDGLTVALARVHDLVPAGPDGEEMDAGT